MLKLPSVALNLLATVIFSSVNLVLRFERRAIYILNWGLMWGGVCVEGWGQGCVRDAEKCAARDFFEFWLKFVNTK